MPYPFSGQAPVICCPALLGRALGVPRKIFSASDRAEAAGLGALDRGDRAGAEDVVVVVAAVGDHVGAGEEGAAVVGHRLVPLQLVESLGGQLIGDALRQVEHVDRDQALLDLGAWAAEEHAIPGDNQEDELFSGDLEKPPRGH